MVKKIILAYSGGLDTSVAIKWLKETYGAEVIAFCAGLGGPGGAGGAGMTDGGLDAVKEKALATGASKAYAEDLRDEFVSDYVFPMLRAGAVYEGVYLLGTSIARPLIAKRQIEILQSEGADCVAHGSTGKGNDQARFELTYYALKPDVQVIAPWREWPFKSRTDLIDYAKKHGIPVSATKEKPYSVDENLFHISYEGGVLEDPWAEAPAGMHTFTVPLEEAGDKPEYVEIDYEGGDPVALNGKKMKPAELLGALNGIAGAHGIGWVDMVENRFVGMKSRGVYETPGGTVLHAAHRALESITLDREVMRLRDGLVPKYAELLYNGYWFSPERSMLQGMADQIQKDVVGTVRLKLYKGNVITVGRKSPRTLYSPELATFEADSVYDQRDAGGFIKLNSLRLRLRDPKGWKNGTS